MTIPVVDIFAGPGGLGEGFSSLISQRTGESIFKIAISAEMETNASRTLRLRAFLRQFPAGEAPSSYYEYVAGRAIAPWTEKTKAQWLAAEHEAKQLTLGRAEDDELLYKRVAKVATQGMPWVLIGGPPCQAYSLVGRARNAGIAGYRAETDERHFLYKHYLQIIERYQPTAFIMENVKGILSAKVGGSNIFPRILEDLRHPGKKGRRYRILPLIDSNFSGELGELSHDQYIIRSEDLGIPQARHRVILFGIDEKLPFPKHFMHQGQNPRVNVRDVIASMPKIRSSITDSYGEEWPIFAKQVMLDTAIEIKESHPEVTRVLRSLARDVSLESDPGTGALRVPRLGRDKSTLPKHLRDWFIDPRLHVHLNHEARGHMRSDLKRYAFASAFADIHGRSPRGHIDFPDSLAPNHENWSSGKFLDRFKVQVWENPSSTVTSHLSKDGHYFIHPDSTQMRSLSVREAARLQTFPDNYFFEGPRGAQFRQVGNAVPPWMARQIAAVVHAAITP